MSAITLKILKRISRIIITSYIYGFICFRSDICKVNIGVLIDEFIISHFADVSNM